jgi:hypothetical protein
MENRLSSGGFQKKCNNALRRSRSAAAVVKPAALTEQIGGKETPAMACRERTVEIRYRVWIVRYEGAPPTAWHVAPTNAVALEPAEPRAMTARRARRYVEAFNRAALDGTQRVWAVALPVTIRYEGDARSGERLGNPATSAHKKSPLPASQVSACNGLPPRDLT